MLEKTGIPSKEQIEAVLPPPERIAREAVAIIECYQEIPCNPCTKACPQNAILPMKDINERPKIDFDKCNGCAMCVAACPGLAISVIDATFGNEDEALVKLPWEFLPLPKKDEVVQTLNRAGEVVGEGRVVRVLDTKAFDRTRVVFLAVPYKDMLEVKSIERRSIRG